MADKKNSTDPNPKNPATGGPRQGPTQEQKPVGIPTIPDTTGGATTPKPIDLSLLAGPIKEPARKPLLNSALGGSFPAQAGITGYAGIFVP